MQRGALLTLPVLMAATSLAGCGLLDGSSDLEDALEVVPGDVDRVTFFDRGPAAERIEVEGAPFDASDLDWEIVGYVDDSFGRAWRLNDDVDLDDLADDLVELGYEETESGDQRTLEIALDQIDEEHAYLVSMQTVTIVPDEHLMITGPLASDLADVVADDDDSAVDTDAFEDLIDNPDDIEVADLARGDGVCSLGKTRLSSEQLEASRLAELGHPDETAFVVYGDDGGTRSVLKFPDDGAAEDDATAREAFLTDGLSPISGVPYSEFGDFDVEADGDQVVIDIDYEDPRDIAAVITRRDYPSVCVP